MPKKKKPGSFLAGGKYRRVRGAARPMGGPSLVVPDWIGFSNGFEFTYEADPQTGKLTPASEKHGKMLDDLIADYLRYRTVISHPDFPARIFQRTFHAGTGATLPKLRTVESIAKQAKGLSHSPESELVLEVLRAMAAGRMPGPLAWKSTPETRWTFNLIHERGLERIAPDGNSEDWVRVVRHAFKADYVSWLDLNRKVSVSRDGAGDRNGRAVPDAKSLKEFLEKKKGKQR